MFTSFEWRGRAEVLMDDPLCYLIPVMEGKKEETPLSAAIVYWLQRLCMR